MRGDERARAIEAMDCHRTKEIGTKVIERATKRKCHGKNLIHDYISADGTNQEDNPKIVLGILVFSQRHLKVL